MAILEVEHLKKNYYQAKPKTLKSGKPCNSHAQPIKSLNN